MKKSYIQLGAAAIVLIAVIGAYLFWYMAVQAKVTETATLSQEIQQQTVATTRVQAAKTELKLLDSDQDTINQYFISTSDVVPFLEKLQATGKFLQADVEVVSVSATPPAANAPTGQLDLSLKITGSFDAVSRTLGSIEYSPYDITLTSLTFDTLNTQNVASSSPVWTATATYSIGTITAADDSVTDTATTTETNSDATSSDTSAQTPDASTTNSSGSTASTSVATSSLIKAT